MLKITIIGNGNVAAILYKEIRSNSQMEVVQVFGRTNSSFAHKDVMARLDKDPIKKADFYMLAISDDAIAKVSKLFDQVEGILVHTSGSVPLDILPKSRRIGVLYPLMTLSSTQNVNFKEVPLCIEAKNEEDLKKLKHFASLLSEYVIEIDTVQRKSLHLAAVFVNNFTNHLYHIGQQICEENSVPFDVLLPLIKETALKIQTLSPFDAQTGPAIRMDSNTINAQLEKLEPDHKELYKLLTRSIQNTYGKKL